MLARALASARRRVLRIPTLKQQYPVASATGTTFKRVHGNCPRQLSALAELGGPGRRAQPTRPLQCSRAVSPWKSALLKRHAPVAFRTLSLSRSRVVPSFLEREFTRNVDDLTRRMQTAFTAEFQLHARGSDETRTCYPICTAFRPHMYRACTALGPYMYRTFAGSWQTYRLKPLDFLAASQPTPAARSACCVNELARARNSFSTSASTPASSSGPLGDSTRPAMTWARAMSTRAWRC